MSNSTGPKGAAIITGGAQGIGLAIGLKLAEDGYSIVFNDLRSNESLLADAVEKAKAKGAQAIAVTADVSVEDDVKHLVQKAVDQYGRLDVMVANAAIPVVKSVNDTTTEEWDRIFAVNVRGTFLCYREAAAQMIKQGGGGRLIGASSISGKQGSIEAAAYVSTKFAIRGLTQSAACDYGKHGITVNAYAPGFIETGFFDVFVDFHAKKENVTSDQRKQLLTSLSPLNTLGSTEDIAGLISYLVSPAARFITGQTISINGGIFFD